MQGYFYYLKAIDCMFLSALFLPLGYSLLLLELSLLGKVYGFSFSFRCKEDTLGHEVIYLNSFS